MSFWARYVAADVYPLVGMVTLACSTGIYIYGHKLRYDPGLAVDKASRTGGIDRMYDYPEKYMYQISKLGLTKFTSTSLFSRDPNTNWMARYKDYDIAEKVEAMHH